MLRSRVKTLLEVSEKLRDLVNEGFNRINIGIHLVRRQK
jgi:hypothetical protein